MISHKRLPEALKRISSKKKQLFTKLQTCYISKLKK